MELRSNKQTLSDWRVGTAHQEPPGIATGLYQGRHYRKTGSARCYHHDCGQATPGGSLWHAVKPARTTDTPQSLEHHDTKDPNWQEGLLLLEMWSRCLLWVTKECRHSGEAEWLGLAQSQAESGSEGWVLSAAFLRVVVPVRPAVILTCSKSSQGLRAFSMSSGHGGCHMWAELASQPEHWVPWGKLYVWCMTLCVPAIVTTVPQAGTNSLHCGLLPGLFIAGSPGGDIDRRCPQSSTLGGMAWVGQARGFPFHVQLDR